MWQFCLNQPSLSSEVAFCFENGPLIALAIKLRQNNETDFESIEINKK